MSDSSFSSILSRQVGTTPKPKPLPIGTYLVVAISHKLNEKVGKNNNAQVVYTCKVLQPQADVDAEQLASVPGGWQDKNANVQFWLTEDSIHRFEAFAKDVCGLDGVSNGQALPMIVGKQFLAHTKHRPGDGDQVYNDWDSYAKAQ